MNDPGGSLITSEKGQPIYHSVFECGDCTLYKDYTSEQLRVMLHVVNANDETVARIKKVTDNAKSFYSDEDKFNQVVEEVFNGNL